MKLQTNMNTEPKILFIDIEVSPITAYSWGPKWESNLLEFVEYTKIITFSSKWLNGKQVTKGLSDYKGYKKGSLDDKKIVLELWNLLNEADVVVGQNSKNFDIKVMNARFVFHGLTPPSSYRSIDTRNEARKYLRLPSYSLDDLCDYFKVGRKMHHEGFDLWLKCMNGDNKAFYTMKKYNAMDVILLEKVYLKLRPWMVSQNLGIFYNSGMRCPNCGSDKLVSEGLRRNKTTIYRTFSCKSCGSWGRSTKNIQEFKPLVSI